MNAGFYPLRVGRFTCTFVTDGTFSYHDPAVTFFAGAPPAALQQALVRHGITAATWHEYISPYPSLVVDTGQQRVLIDVGAGGLAPTTGQLPANLREAGITPESIDLVILTHGHADHIGGIVDAEGRLNYPNARYVMWKQEWQFWTQNPDLSVLRAPDWIKQALVAIAAQQLPAIADRVDLIDREEEIVPGIAAVAAPGHTPGHMAVAIKSGGDQLLHLVDTVLSPIHLEEPDWTSAVDYDPVQTAATRRKLLARAAREQLRVAVYHFPFPGLGRVVPYNGAWQWDPELLERE